MYTSVCIVSIIIDKYITLLHVRISYLRIYAFLFDIRMYLSVRDLLLCLVRTRLIYFYVSLTTDTYTYTCALYDVYAMK